MANDLSSPWGKPAVALLGLLISISLGPPMTSQAADAGGGQSDEMANWAYAAFQGTGVYRIGESTMGVLALQFSSEVDPGWLDEGQGVLEITYPVIIGVYDFDVREHGFSNLQERLGTLSLVPGLHFHYQPCDDWLLTPFVEGGVGKIITESGYYWIYSGGLESRFSFSLAAEDFMLGNRLRWAGYTVGDSGFSDDYYSLESILEYYIDSPWTPLERQAGFSVYLFNQLNFSADVLRYSPGDSLELGSLWEVGAALELQGEEEGEEDFLNSLRIGLGYRIGHKLRAIKIIFGNVF
ncbi:MAG: hypothetical protein ABFR97_03610 [Thermodesulfobacteriota bacterium]